MNTSLSSQKNEAVRPTFAHHCRASCRRLLSQIEKTKNSILAEFRGTLGAHEQLLGLALNEAESLAWQTAFPHLVFPMLATEKAEAVAAWHARQQSMRRTGSLSARDA